ncbi:2930_t:CDS:2 [Acaulospora morrowiae]|uniref:2930_t:CDS:1 n=1 Tax=Acaulospora morrowiae TaxID=94023 RepID=A0A9N8WNH5_9GLOM|nr:2930_t:CDS:2 [Acaulospora morrowiae]
MVPSLAAQVQMTTEGEFTQSKLTELIGCLLKLGKSGATEENNVAVKNGMNFLRSKQKEITLNRQQNATQPTVEQINRLRCQKEAFSHLSANKSISDNLFLGMLKNEDLEQVTQLNELIEQTEIKVPPLFHLETEEQAAVAVAMFPTPQQVEQMSEAADEREIELSNRIKMRIKELEQLPSNLSNESLNVGGRTKHNTAGPKIKALIERKGYKLRACQQKLRNEIMKYSIHRRPVRIISLKQYERPVPKILKNATYYENLEREKREAYKRRIKEERSAYFNAIFHQTNYMKHISHNKQTMREKLGRSVIIYHAQLQKQVQKQLERSSKERINALKNNDEEAYMKLIDEHKDKRITHLLRQTDLFLGSLTKAVVDHQKDHKNENNLVAPDISVTDDDNVIEALDGKKVDYHSIAHRIEETVEQPGILVGGELKDYQLKGLQWMVSLYNNHLNGILADEMGLGKTIQTISLITYLIEKKQQNGPYLIIVPLSTMTNWQLEFEKWAPSVKICTYKGTPANRKLIQRQYLKNLNCQVFLTTYEYVIKDKAVLSKPRWLYCIIDEGHRMKNTNSKLSLVLSNDYTLRYRLILTGTPLQNNLPELWSLLNFILPKIFNSVNSFEEWFNTPFANTGGQDKIALNEEESLLVIRRLHKVLRPFLLRRLKKDVESQLPDKVERIIKVKLSALQQKLYNQMKTHGAIFVGTGERGKTGVRSHRNTVMQLRKICNHPFVFSEVEKDINPNNDNNHLLVRVSGKFDFLDRVLPKYFKANHRVLLFCQMTNILTIMEDFLNFRGYKYLRLDGSIKSDDRTILLKKFNSPDSPYFIFLLSTRAGGLGLNLQSADTVILYDSDWNPHQDLQAQDRAHRVGQTKKVQVLRLITQNSVEEKVLAKAQFKLDMDGKVIQAGKFDQTSTDKARDEFLRSLLEGDNTDGNSADEREDLDDDEINEIISRDERELELFRQMDIARIREETAEWKAKGLPIPERLIQESELPEVYLRDYKTIPDDGVEYGRGQRQRKEVIYDDGLTEDQFLNAVENNVDIENLIAKKQLSNRQRQVKKKNKQDTENVEESSPDVPDEPETENIPPIRRNRKGRDPVEFTDESIVRSKVKLENGEKTERKRKDFNDDAPTDIPEVDSESDDVQTIKNKRKGKARDPAEMTDESVTKITVKKTDKVKSEGETVEKSESSKYKVKNKKKKGSTIITLSLEKGAKVHKVETTTSSDESKQKRRKSKKLSGENNNDLFMECLVQIENVRVKSRKGYRHRAALFYDLPSQEEYPYYYDQIKKPISINIIRQKILDNDYDDADEFKHDIELMFSNAKTFNLEGSEVYNDADVMQKVFFAKFESFFGKNQETTATFEHTL